MTDPVYTCSIFGCGPLLIAYLYKVISFSVEGWAVGLGVWRWAPLLLELILLFDLEHLKLFLSYSMWAYN